MNNIRRLKEECDIAEVVDRLNIPQKPRGANIFIPCPCPEHDDKNWTNCCFKKGDNFVYCHACGKKITPVDLIIYSTGCEYGDACDMLWEICGSPDWYYQKNNPKKEHGFYVMQNELNFLGIRLKSHVDMPISESSKKEFLNSELPHNVYYAGGSEKYLLVKSTTCLEWEDFYTQKQMCSLIIRKANEKKEKIETAIKLMPGLDDTSSVREMLDTLSGLVNRAKNGQRCSSKTA